MRNNAQKSWGFYRIANITRLLTTSTHNRCKFLLLKRKACVYNVPGLSSTICDHENLVPSTSGSEESSGPNAIDKETALTGIWRDFGPRRLSTLTELSGRRRFYAT